VKELARKAALRSPLLSAVIRDIQVSLGRIGRPDPEDDALIYEEAVRQLIDTYFDVDGARRFIEGIRSGGIEVIVRRTGPPSPLTLQLRRTPSIKPWARDATPLIIKSLEGMAFTVEELSEMLDLPPRTIESRLKELRKPGSPARVFQFIDLSFDEWRWALVKDAPQIYVSEEFADSFEPMDPDEAFVLMVKPMAGESYYNIIFTPKDIQRNAEKFAEKIPVEEAHEVKVMPLSDSLLRSLAPKYYHVPRTIMPYIALNGAAFLQKLKEYNYLVVN
jgi:ATP-dependent Lhr-like helicase